MLTNLDLDWWENCPQRLPRHQSPKSTQKHIFTEYISNFNTLPWKRLIHSHLVAILVFPLHHQLKYASPQSLDCRWRDRCCLKTMNSYWEKTNLPYHSFGHLIQFALKKTTYAIQSDNAPFKKTLRKCVTLTNYVAEWNSRNMQNVSRGTFSRWTHVIWESLLRLVSWWLYFQEHGLWKNKIYYI